MTVLGKKYDLNTPFMVLATQNPVDHEGTYPLPEAQSDRFMFKIAMPYPGPDTLKMIMKAKAGLADHDPSEPNRAPGRCTHLPGTSEEAERWFRNVHHQIRYIKSSPSLEAHIVNMLLASNGYHDQLTGLDNRQKHTLKELADKLFVFGLGPRVAEDLMMASKAWSLMFLRHAQEEYAGAEALASVVIPVLRHRIKKIFDWEERYAAIHKMDLKDDEPRDGLLETMMVEFCDAAAPSGKNNHYRQSLRQVLLKMASPRWIKRGGLF